VKDVKYSGEDFSIIAGRLSTGMTTVSNNIAHSTNKSRAPKKQRH
jgi:hypothetical protein